MPRTLAATLLCLLALTASAFAADPAPADADTPDTFGKTDAEILAMGESGWYDFYTAPERGGESTAGMASAYGLYADAAQRRNDALPQKNHARELGKLLDDFGENSIVLASNFSGGGTIWIPLYSEADCEVETVVYGLLGGQVDAAQPATTGLLTRDLNKLAQDIETEHADKDAALYFKYGDAKSTLRTLRADFTQITALAAKLPRADSDRILQFCHTWATVGFGEDK